MPASIGGICPARFFARAYREHGPVFRIKLFNKTHTVLAGADALSGTSVTGKIVGTTKGPKINGFTYKAKKHQSRRYGHRQKYTLVEIVSITKS